MRSLVVDAENNTCAEEGAVRVGERGVVIILLIPEAFACNAHTLTVELADNCLHDDLVGWYAQLLHGGAYLISQLLCEVLSLLVLVDFLVGKVLGDNFFDALAHLRGIETVAFLGLEAVSVVENGSVEAFHDVFFSNYK